MERELVEAAILAGGFGTRLRSVIADRPKSMADVASKPFLEWLVLQLRAKGIKRIVLCTGYLHEVVEGYFQDGRKWGLQIDYSHEEEALGTGGALRLALAEIRDSTVLVLNGDSYCRFTMDALAGTHFGHSAAATMYLVKMDDCRRFGAVELNGDNSVRTFVEKPAEQRGCCINAGVYLIERKAIESIPENRKISLEREVFTSMIGRGLFGMVGGGPFIDIGTPESYASAVEFMHSEANLKSNLLPSGGEVI